MSETISILIRNKYRPELFQRCIQSIACQTYKDVNVIVASDTSEGYDNSKDVLKDTELSFKCFGTIPQKEYPAYWNLYCNELKERVNEGYFFMCDNDDFLASPTVLQELSEHLTPDSGIICQFLRNGRPKPDDRLIRQRRIIKGRIGGGSLVLHHSHKNLGDWTGEVAADFVYIKTISEKIPLKFIPLVLQITDQKNNGK